MTIASANPSPWSSLLREPKSVLGPYRGVEPGLDTFAPHSWRMDFHQVCIAGQFLELPGQPPESWCEDGICRAYAVFEFLGVRALQCSGALSCAGDDDALHGTPIGLPARCALAELPEPWFDNPANGAQRRWRTFEVVQSEFKLRLEAQEVTLYLGRKAQGQYGWPIER